MKRIAAVLALAILFIAGSALATHESITEFHPWSTTVRLGNKTTTASGTITDVDPVPHASTVTVTVTQGTTTSPPTGYAVNPPVGPFEVRDGGGTQEAGVFAYTRGPYFVEKKHVKNYYGWGMFLMQWPEQTSLGTVEVYDSIAENITMSPPMSGNGTKEAGFWFGQTTQARRLEVNGASWMAYWFGGNFDGSVVEHIKSRNILNVGMYFEHAARNSRVSWFDIEADAVGDGGWVRAGAVNFEWAYSDGYEKYMPAAVRSNYPGRSAPHNIELSYGRVRSGDPNAPCIFIGPGVFGIKLHHLRLENCNVGVMYTNRNLHPTAPVVEIDWSTIELVGVQQAEQIRTDLAIGP